jgi:RNA polymerase sigma-70 factor (ECF subfamily)
MQLVERLLNRDQKAFDMFYDTYATVLLRRLHRLTGNPHDAEDCLQQVFIQVMLSLKNYRADGALGAWLNRIATHVALNFFRKQRRLHSFLQRLVPEKEPDVFEQAIPERLFMLRECRQLIWMILDKLSPHKRIALMMCDLEGYTIQEAADQIDVPLGTMVSRLHHGRKQFKHYLQLESRRWGLSVDDLLRE